MRFVVAFWANQFRSMCNNSQKKETKKTPPNIEVCPESLEAILEYWCIERGLS